MKFKKWNITMILFVCMIMVGVMITNYVVDPFGYFSFQTGDSENLPFPIDTTYALRELKAQRVIHYQDEYDAYIIGGSKAGSYQTETMLELDGYRYYNLFELGGNFAEYELIAQFLFSKTVPKKIILNISGGEVRAFERAHTAVNQRLPAVETGSSKILEYIDFLTMDIKRSINRVKERRSDKDMEGLQSDGSRVLRKYYTEIEKDPAEFIDKQVNKRLSKHLHTLFATNNKREYYDDNLESLQRIKEMCEEHGTELMVLVAPSYIGEMSEHDTTYYWEYMEQMAAITDYWDFSGYNDINLNPYNYYNEGHFFYEVAELMVDTINGTNSYPGFGKYVTLENVSGHIAQRKADYERLQQEYLQTGTIQLQGWEDASCLVND